MDLEHVLARLRERIDAAGGVAVWARRHAVSEQYTRDVVAGRRLPGPSVLAAIGLKKDTVITTTYSEAPAHG